MSRTAPESLFISMLFFLHSFNRLDEMEPGEGKMRLFIVAKTLQSILEHVETD